MGLFDLLGTALAVCVLLMFWGIWIAVAAGLLVRALTATRDAIRTCGRATALRLFLATIMAVGPMGCAALVPGIMLATPFISSALAAVPLGLLPRCASRPIFNGKQIYGRPDPSCPPYNAVGDDSTDDYAAIAAAITDGIGQGIYLSKSEAGGIYRVSQTLVIPAGQNDFKFFCESGVILKITSDTGVVDFDSSTGQQVRPGMENCQLQEAAASPTFGIRIGDSANSIRSAEFRNVAIVGEFGLGVDCVRLQGSAFFNLEINTNQTADFKSNDLCRGNSIYDSYFYGGADYGVWVRASSSLTMHGGVVEGGFTTCGVFFEPFAAGEGALEMFGVYLENIGGTGCDIYVYGGSGGGRFGAYGLVGGDIVIGDGVAAVSRVRIIGGRARSIVVNSNASAYICNITHSTIRAYGVVRGCGSDSYSGTPGVGNFSGAFRFDFQNDTQAVIPDASNPGTPAPATTLYPIHQQLGDNYDTDSGEYGMKSGGVWAHCDDPDGCYVCLPTGASLGANFAFQFYLIMLGNADSTPPIIVKESECPGNTKVSNFYHASSTEFSLGYNAYAMCFGSGDNWTCMPMFAE